MCCVARAARILYGSFAGRERERENVPLHNFLIPWNNLLLSFFMTWAIKLNIKLCTPKIYGLLKAGHCFSFSATQLASSSTQAAAPQHPSHMTPSHMCSVSCQHLERILFLTFSNSFFSPFLFPDLSLSQITFASSLFFLLLKSLRNI